MSSDSDSSGVGADCRQPCAAALNVLTGAIDIGAKRIDKFQPLKILFVVGGDDAAVGASNLPQSRAAFSAKGSTRPAKSACGPSGPANQASSAARFFPAGFSSNPRRISPTVSAETNRSLSFCSHI